ANITNAGAIHRFPTAGGSELSRILPFTWSDSGGRFSPTGPPRTWIARNGSLFYSDCPLDSGSCTIQRVSSDGTQTQTIATFAGTEAYVRAVDDTSIYVPNV